MKDKQQRLREQMDKYTEKDVCIAFSGGIDSSILLRLAVDGAKANGTKVYAVTFDTVLHPRCDVEIARRVAGELGAVHHVISVNELENSEICQNPRNRCYLCKKTLFTQLLDFAAKKEISTVLEGTNQDDLSQYRPGLQAIEELGIISPLSRNGFTKKEIRKWAEELGISVAHRPSTPCLATRLPYGTRIEPEVLENIEKGEAFLRDLGFVNVRIRLHNKIARIELDQDAFGACLECAGKVTEYLKSLGFPYVTLDLEGFRSGSMDE